MFTFEKRNMAVKGFKKTTKKNALLIRLWIDLKCPLILWCCHWSPRYAKLYMISDVRGDVSLHFHSLLFSWEIYSLVCWRLPSVGDCERSSPPRMISLLSRVAWYWRTVSLLTASYCCCCCCCCCHCQRSKFHWNKKTCKSWFVRRNLKVVPLKWKLSTSNSNGNVFIIAEESSFLANET